MSIIVPANTLAAADGGYDVDNSLRFHSNTYLSATFGSAPTLATKNTFSMWFKRSTLGTLQQLMATHSNAVSIVINTNDTIAFYTNSGQLLSPKVYRDTSAWMHFVYTFDSTQGTAANRTKVYINGVQETSFNNTAYPAQEASQLGVNGQVMKIGTRTQNDRIFEGYIAETAFVDGQALAADSFGEFDDSGNWRAIDISDLTFGNNGFYLEYKAAGTGTNSSGMGADTSGNDFHFAVTNLTAVDQSTDTCTNNFCTINSLDNFYAASTLSKGNLKVLTISGKAAYNPATFGLIKGKWYWEVKLVTCSAGDGSEATIIGISNQSPVNAGYAGSIVVNDGIGIRGNGKAWGADGSSGGGQETSGWDAIAVGNTAMIAVDFDNGKLYHGINGTWGNSGDPTSGSSGTGAYAFTVGTDVWFPGVNQRETSQTATFELNFGSPPYAISSGNQDADGFGNFEYAVPSGYIALCTKNLAEYG